MSLDLNPTLEAEIRQRAAAEGVTTSQLIDRLLHSSSVKQESAAPKSEIHSVDPANDASIALLQAWLEEDVTDDPEEVRKAEEELADFKRNMNLPRKEAGARIHYPEAE